MKLKSIEKRDGRIVPFESQKIKTAIEKAFLNTQGPIHDLVLDFLTDKVTGALEDEGVETPTVEHVQDVVVKTLAQNGYPEVAERYSQYRLNRTRARENRDNVRRAIAAIVRETSRENANVGNGPSAKLLQMAEAVGRDFAEKELTSPEVLRAMKDNILYPHDYSWAPIGTTTCTFIPLGKCLANGFNNGHGWVRSPKRIKTAAQLSCIIMQSNQNDQHGGQAYGWYDRDLAPYVTKEYEWQKENLKKSLAALGVEASEEAIAERAWQLTREETFQAMEGVVFNANTMHSRAGAQTPFFSINFGTDTSREGRLISEALLLAYEKGLGKGEQPLFPNLIFKVRKGVNAEPEDPNYDLFLLSVRVSSKRLFPNYVFQDSSFNKDFPGDVPTMGCRTRISWNINGDVQTCEGRGNLSFTSLNLVRIALNVTRGRAPEEVHERFSKLQADFKLELPSHYAEKPSVQAFFVALNRYVDLGIQQLYERYKYQISFTKKDFPFLLDGIWMDSDKLSEADSLEKVWKHGTLSLGFVGLAEALKCIVGAHHGESPDADLLGEQIVKFMRSKTDLAAKAYSLNFSLLATPAEGLTGKFAERDQRDFGRIEGVTDKDWYTNSFHVPVEYKCSAYHKIRVEGKYHKYCNAGHISYIELDSAPTDNIEAIVDLLKYMGENDMGYVAINFPVDRCRNCGYTGVIEDACPVCEGKDISRIRRITGYLAELSMFNHAKQEETKNRQSHYIQH